MLLADSHFTAAATKNYAASRAFLCQIPFCPTFLSFFQPLRSTTMNGYSSISFRRAPFSVFAISTYPCSPTTRKHLYASIGCWRTQQQKGRSRSNGERWIYIWEVRFPCICMIHGIEPEQQQGSPYVESHHL